MFTRCKTLLLFNIFVEYLFDYLILFFPTHFKIGFYILKNYFWTSKRYNKKNCEMYILSGNINYFSACCTNQIGQ